MVWDNTNLSETWRKFQSTVELMFKEPFQPKDEAIKVSYLFLLVGEPKLNPIFSRYKFNLATQETDTIEQYLTKLKTLAKDCNFNDPDEIIRERIVFGVSEERAREKLINVGSDLTLDRAVQIVQTYEYSQIQLKAMKGEVDEVQAKSSFHLPFPTAIEVAILIVMEMQAASVKKLPSNDVTIQMQADHKFGTCQVESTYSRSRTSPWEKALQQVWLSS